MSEWLTPSHLETSLSVIHFPSDPRARPQFCILSLCLGGMPTETLITALKYPFLSNHTCVVLMLANAYKCIMQISCYSIVHCIVVGYKGLN